MTSKIFDRSMFRGNRSPSRVRLGYSAESTKPEKPVGLLDVEVVEAVDLIAADFTGKSDPYVILELDGQSYRTNTQYSTLSPKWTDEIAQFAIADISSILYITVFDQDRFLEPEFLGRVGIPVATILNGTKLRRVLQLRDKSLSRHTKGTIEITVHKKWDPWKARPKTDPAMKKAQLVSALM